MVHSKEWVVEFCHCFIFDFRNMNKASKTCLSLAYF